MADPREELIGRLWAVVLNAHGGEEVRQMAIAHYRDGRTLQDIGREHGVSASTVHRRVFALRTALAREGIYPEWFVPHSRNESRRTTGPSPIL